MIVNPYDTDELARAIHTALTIPDEERRARMARMRAVVKEHNIYQWAGNLIGELAEIRLEPAEADQPGRRDSLTRNTQFTIEDPKIYAKPWTNKQDGFAAKIG